MPKTIEVGYKFEKLTVAGERFKVDRKCKSDPRGYTYNYYRVCECDCGQFTILMETEIRRATIKSCGCNIGEFHGEAGSRLYNVWQCMRARCYRKSDPRYRLYGARGIGVCDEWNRSYLTFSAWAKASGYAEGLELDREDNDKNYTPSNCRWVTHQQNTDNRRDTLWIEAFSERKTISQWLKDPRCVALKRLGLDARLRAGWPPELAITAPIGHKYRNEGLRKTNVWVTAFGETKTLTQWASDPRCVVKAGTLRRRINDGWNHLEALTRPSSPFPRTTTKTKKPTQKDVPRKSKQSQAKNRAKPKANPFASRQDK